MIKILSRRVVDNIIEQKVKPFHDESWALISIVDGEHDGIITKNSISPIEGNWELLKSINCVGAISLQFDDIEEPKDDDFAQYVKEKELILFNDIHADRITSFLSFVNAKNLLVHCAAGVSRSGAVGCFAARAYPKFNDIEKRLHEAHNIAPNGFILSKLSCSMWEEKLNEK